MIAADRPFSRGRPVIARGPALAKARFLVREDYPLSTEGFGVVDGLSAAEADPVVIVPRFVKRMIAAQERCASDKAPNLTIAQWLHAQPPAVQRRERLRALRKLGLVTL